VRDNLSSGVVLAEENCEWFICPWVRRGDPVG